MADLYLYDDVPVLRNKLDIRDGDTLDIVEAGMSRANMMLLYESGFRDFSPEGLCAIHRALFEDIYEWAGRYRIINIEKRERLLAGRSVWYSNDEDIPTDLQMAFDALNSQPWERFSKEEFVRALAEFFPPIWQVHPFREGNTRVVVMMMSLFVEHTVSIWTTNCWPPAPDMFVIRLSWRRWGRFRSVSIWSGYCWMRSARSQCSMTWIRWIWTRPNGSLKSTASIKKNRMFQSRIINGRIAEPGTQINTRMPMGQDVRKDVLPRFCCLPILLDMAGGIRYDVGYKTMRRYQNERENFL